MVECSEVAFLFQKAEKQKRVRKIEMWKNQGRFESVEVKSIFMNNLFFIQHRDFSIEARLRTRRFLFLSVAFSSLLAAVDGSLSSGKFQIKG